MPFGINVPRGRQWRKQLIAGGSNLGAVNPPFHVVPSADPSGAVKGSRWHSSSAPNLPKIHNGTRALFVTAALTGTAVQDFASVATGAATSAVDVTVTGAAVGDVAVADISTGSGASADASRYCVFARVRAANTVAVWVLNFSGGAVDLASGTIRVWVYKAE